ncbi:MAG: hypothetical protein FWE49_00980 [Synergistaceae bacterium]|nr:hypothetical protein [Synergistaceae bacterium]
MKIKWKFEEEQEDFDEHGNLKPYYKDSEPWKKLSNKGNPLLQILKIILALVLCIVFVFICLTIHDYYGQDWNQFPGVQIIRSIINRHMQP